MATPGQKPADPEGLRTAARTGRPIPPLCWEREQHLFQASRLRRWCRDEPALGGGTVSHRN